MGAEFRESRFIAKVRRVKIEVASSICKQEWQAAEIYPNKGSTVYRLSDEQIAKISAFVSD